MNKDAKSTFLFGLTIAIGAIGVVWVVADWPVALIAAIACFGTLMACVGAETGGLR